MLKRNSATLVLLLLLTIMIAPVSAQGVDGPDDGLMGFIESIGVTKVALGITGLGTVLATSFIWLLAKRYDRDLPLIHYAIIALTIATALIHLMIGINGNLLLLANGAGYLVLLALCYLPLSVLDAFRKALSLALIVYTIITIAGYFLTHNYLDTLALVTKIDEVLLVLALIVSAVLVPLPAPFHLADEIL